MDTLDAKRIEEILNRLPLMVVALDPDPVSRGPQYLQNLISNVRGLLNETGVYVQEILRYKSALDSNLEALTVAFEVSADELLADNKEVSQLPAVQDRQAKINCLLRDQRKEILNLKKQVNDIGYLEKAVRHRHRELEATMSAIRLQRSLIQSEIRTGSFYGDETSTSRGKSALSGSDDGIEVDEMELSKLLDKAAELSAEDEVSTPAIESDFDDDIGLDPEKTEKISSGSTKLQSPWLFCEDCGEPQFDTVHGLTCKNGHGGAPSVAKPEVVAAPVDASIEKFLSGDSDDDFSDIFSNLD
jgi:hypothetical protein